MEERNGKGMDHGRMVALYVGDLAPATLESDLYSIFSPIGTITHIKIIRHMGDPTDLCAMSCYAYVNYTREEDAVKATQKLNFFELHGRQIRVMPCNKDILRIQTGSNVLVKNLPENLDNKTLHDTFKVFGDIVSCKIATTFNGKPLGYGYVQYKDKQSAKKAIRYGTGTKMKECQLTVAPHKRMDERVSKKGDVDSLFTNVYIKNFPPITAKEEIENLLRIYGELTSVYFPLKEDGSSRGFAFANFETHESAVRAINALHGLHVMESYKRLGNGGEDDIFPESLYIQRAQPKSEREEALRKSITRMCLEGQNYKRNLYVTNIPKSFTSKDLREVFKEYGTIVSIHMGADANTVGAKQYAYVCMFTPDEASVALEKANELYLDGSKLQVTYFKSKQERAQERESPGEFLTYSPNMAYLYPRVGGYGGSAPTLFSGMGGAGYNNKIQPSKKSFDKKQIGGRLYNLVLSTSPMFQDTWRGLGMKDEHEFAEIITRSLLEKPSNEVRDMLGLGNVLSANIGDILDEMHDTTAVDGNKAHGRGK
jgi:polyadenylate-binding protein